MTLQITGQAWGLGGGVLPTDLLDVYMLCTVTESKTSCCIGQVGLLAYVVPATSPGRVCLGAK